MKAYTTFLVFLVLIAGASAQLLNPTDASGINGMTWEQQFQTFVADGLQTKFNTTQAFLNSTHTMLWVPQYSSSSACGVAQLQSYSSGACATPSMTANMMVTDEYSEVGMALAMSNRTTEFDQWYNTIGAVLAVTTTPYLPSWRYCRDGSTITDISSDSASDATVRIIKALYIASQNDDHTTSNRTKYLALANEMTEAHYQYETKKECYTSAITGEPICVWLAGGKNAAGAFSSDPFIWGGYFYDAITAMLAACSQTGNQTYCLAASNYTAQMLTAQWNNTGGGSSDFRVSPFSWRYSSGPPTMNAGNSYHFNPSNPQWDDSDRPRGLQDCDVLRVANITLGGISGVYQNLSDYCVAWSNSATYTDTTTCLQYFYNGTCAVGPSTGFYQNGFGAFLHTYYNTSGFVPKVNETVTHYSYSLDTFDSSSCGNALTYRGVRPTKALGIGLGYEDGIYSLALSNSINIDIFYATNGSTVTEDVNVTISGGIIEYDNSTSTGNILYTGLPSNTYTVAFSGGGFTETYYTVTVSGGSIGQLNAYLSKSEETGNNTVVFTLQNSESLTSIEGAVMTLSKSVNGTLTLVQSRESDITGRVLFTYTSGTRYSFTVTANGYEGITFELNPILFSSYDVKLQRSTGLNSSIDYYGVTIQMNSTRFEEDVVTPVLFTITSAEGLLTSYTVNFTYPGGSNSTTGTNSYGQSSTFLVAPSGSNPGDAVQLSYCYTTSIGGQRCFSKNYLITGSYEENTIIGNIDSTFGMGLFERILLATAAIVVVFGIVAIIGGSVLAGLLSMAMFIFFVVAGFIPLLAASIPVILLLILVVRRSGE